MLGNFEGVQKSSKYTIDATMKSFSALSKSSQTIATEMADYSKRSFENGTKAAEKLFGANSLDKVIEVQSEYARTICEDYTAQITKLGALYANLAKEAFGPYEGLAAKTTSAK